MNDTTAILIFIICSGVYAASNDTVSFSTTTKVAEDLQDSDFGSWESCASNEPCANKRFHTCTKNTVNPTVSCGQNVWKEEMHGCYICNSIWLALPNWSVCEGTGCGDTVQTSTFKCANVAVNENCKLVKTKFCDPSMICNGTWSSWSSETKSCQDTCETNRKRMITRSCLKDGEESSNCDKSRKQYTQMNVETCIARPCTTTISTTAVATSVPETTAQTTTTEAILITEWTQWNSCNASCEQTLGKQQRSRKCTYQSSKDNPTKKSCSNYKLLDTRSCTIQDEIKCTSPQPKNSVTTSESQQTTENLLPDPKAFGVAKPQTATKAAYQITTALYTTPGSNVESGLTKQQYQILVIALGTAAGLFVIVIIIYTICGSRRSKKRKRRRKLGEISVVALESHTGFMEGMEKYGFKKSMMPNDTLLTSLHPPIIPGRENSNQISVQENQNSHHIYEDVNLLASEIHAPTVNNIKTPMRRSVSQREKQQDCYNDEVVRRRSCFVDTHYGTRHKTAPPKPPRRSMPQLDLPDKYEHIDTTGASYKPQSPALDFIQNIHPPSTTPPITPQPQLKTTTPTNENNPAPPSKSAPASPANYQMGALYTTQIPFINCMSSSLLVPYSNIPVMTTMHRHSGDVIYMPSLMPIQQAKIMTDVATGSTSQMTPLHGTNIRTSEQNLYLSSKPRPHSTGVLPVLSLIDTDLYQPPRQVPTVADNNLSKNDTLNQPSHEGTACQRRSFKNLHGTQHGEISSPQRINQAETSNEVNTEIAEDFEGYVIALKEN